MAPTQTIRIGHKLMDFSKPRIMGILNLTPDSFSDGGLHNHPDRALDHAMSMLADGADLLDFGAASSRPGAADVSEQEELDRLMPALEKIMARAPHAVISVDTWRANVAEEALRAGATIINDITAAKGDERMAEVAVRWGAPLVLMHMQGTPQTMQQNPSYSDVVNEVAYFFSERINTLRLAGVRDIILDPGFGFGKTMSHNYTMAARFAEFGMFGLPMLAGVSRKRMLYELTRTEPVDTVASGAALHGHLLRSGAAILRVHDVREAAQSIAVHIALLGQQDD